MELASPGRGPEASSRSTVLIAVGVKGVLIIKSDSLVVWALIRDAASCARVRGLTFEVFVMCPSFDGGVERGLDAFRSWPMRELIVSTVLFKAARSFSALEVVAAIATADRVCGWRLLFDRWASLVSQK